MKIVYAQVWDQGLTFYQIIRLLNQLREIGDEVKESIFSVTMGVKLSVLIHGLNDWFNFDYLHCRKNRVYFLIILISKHKLVQYLTHKLTHLKAQSCLNSFNSYADHWKRSPYHTTYMLFWWHEYSFLNQFYFFSCEKSESQLWHKQKISMMRTFNIV